LRLKNARYYSLLFQRRVREDFVEEAAKPLKIPPNLPLEKGGIYRAFLRPQSLSIAAPIISSLIE
jgi:hypothetical protein